MKKLWKKVLLLSVMFVLAMSVRSFAASTQYSAKTLTFPNAYGAGWSNQFTVSAQTNIEVSISISGPNGEALNGTTMNAINRGMKYLLENVKTHQQYYLTDINYTASSYAVHMTVPAGTYSFGVYYSESYGFKLYFRVTGTSGINVPDSLEIQVGTSTVVNITQTNVYGGFMWVDYYTSSNPAIAEVTNINNSVAPSQITIAGKAVGKANITVYSTDGSSDTMSVEVTSAAARPTLLYSTLNMSGGEVVYNEILSKAAGATVRWTSSDSDVAKVSKKSGKITATGYGRATITAKVTQNGKDYSLACTVNVSKTDPDFTIQLTNLAPKKRKLKISITNKSGVDMVVYSGGARLLQASDLLPIRTLKMKNDTKMTIKNGKTVKVPFIIKGGKLPYSKPFYGVRVKFKLDGSTYYARCTVDPKLGQYILKANLGTNNWMYSYSDG